jgi:hypothetical protein
MCGRDTGRCPINENNCRDYDKFSADTSIY